jgi:hypothetical protein
MRIDDYKKNTKHKVESTNLLGSLENVKVMIVYAPQQPQ